MAEIVLIHGIAQEQRGAAQLEAEWLPALADGLHAAGHPGLAGLLWPLTGAPDQITAAMAFYGDLFLDPGTMGEGSVDDLLEGDDADLRAAIAEEWLHHAASTDRHTLDQRAATTELSYLHPHGYEEQGRAKEAQRAALNALTRLRWFAPFGMAFAGKFVAKALTQVTAYLGDPNIRAQVQQRVDRLIGPDTRIIIGHSLGSVIAYEAAHRLTHNVPLLITLGSPLGLRSVVCDRTHPQPPGYPPQVTRWVNIADRNDLVAAEPDLRPQFGSPPPGATFDASWTVANGAKPHQAIFYLGKRQVGVPIATALSG